MINDIKEIIGIIFMIIVGGMFLGAFASSLENEIVSQFTSLGITLLVISGLAGIFVIIRNWAR